MLVVDVVKGVQTQTAECLLIGELTCPRMVVVLNKVDLLPPNKRQSAIEKMTKRLHKTLESTRSALIYTTLYPGLFRGERYVDSLTASTPHHEIILALLFSDGQV